LYLGNDEIRQAISKGLIEIDPFDESHVEPASYDLTLHHRFKIIKGCNFHEGIFGSYINPSLPLEYRKGNYGHEKFNGHVIIQPKEFVIASTEEYIKLDKCIAGRVDGKSTVGRCGLFIENAGFVDPGFEGQLTLELFNATDYPVYLEEGMKICQLVFSYVSGCSRVMMDNIKGRKVQQVQRG